MSYEDDGKDWATPERFLRIVAPVRRPSSRRGAERTKPQFLSGCVDAGVGRAYVPTRGRGRRAPGREPAARSCRQRRRRPPLDARRPHRALGRRRRRPRSSPAPAPAVLPAPSPPRAPSPPAAGRICAARSSRPSPGVGRRPRGKWATKRYCGTVKARGNGDILPVGCPPPKPGERIWRVLYDDDGQDWDTPGRFSPASSSAQSPRPRRRRSATTLRIAWPRGTAARCRRPGEEALIARWDVLQSSRASQSGDGATSTTAPSGRRPSACFPAPWSHRAAANAGAAATNSTAVAAAEAPAPEPP